MNQFLISVEEMAKKLDVPVSWLYARTRTNDIPHLKVGKYVRFDPDQVMHWIRKQNEIDAEGRIDEPCR